MARDRSSSTFATRLVHLGAAWRRFVLLLLAAFASTSCSAPREDESGAPAVIGSIAQALDTDSDGMDDAWETTHFGNLTQTAAGDFDGDGMTNLEEYLNGFNPTVADAFDDADGDRYPNIHEIRSSSDPNSAASIPTPTFLVNGAGGGTHTTVNAALTAMAGQSNNYPIIGIAAGTYTGSGNLGFSFGSGSTKKPLIIGLDGAAKTIFQDGIGWTIYGTSILSSLTFQRLSSPLYASTTVGEVRFVDLRVLDSSGSSYAMGLHIAAAAKTYIVGSTFLNNTTHPSYGQIYITGNAQILNTVVSGTSSTPMLVKAASATLTTNYSFVKGQTLTGTGNLSGATDPKLLPSGRLRWDSPLRSAGATFPHSRIDMDGELRPTSAPDMGVDQFIDTDSDQLADSWELARTGNLTTLTSQSQDGDSDGLTNEQEYVNDTHPTVADTDGDGLSDGAEVTTHGTNPLKLDTDGDDMPDAWEVSYGLQATVADGFDDADGDRFPNIYEYVYSTNPTDRASTPTPAIVVNGAGGGTHTTVNAALATMAGQPNNYPIIGIAPGTYTGSGNTGLSFGSQSTKKPLIIGLEGAAKTSVQDGAGWTIYGNALISSLTFQRMSSPLYVSTTTGEVRFVELRVLDSSGSSYAMGLHVAAAAKTYIAGSTFLNNTTHPSYGQIYITGNAQVRNTVVSGTSSTPMLVKASGATLTTDYCLVKGQTLTGTGNLPGATNPKLHGDGRLQSDSPLRAAGTPGVIASSSRLDMDLELRSSSSPDIGVDQFGDSDADGLPDVWEIARFGNLGTASGSGDNDSDGLNNLGEYDRGTSPTNPDTDGDGIKDGTEVAIGTNPVVHDSQELGVDLNQDGVIESIGAQLGYAPDQADTDGDSISNAQEALACTNPLSADTDGDGVPDNTDPFPHDPLMSVFPSNPLDVTPPVITLTAPWYAVEQ